MDNLSMAELAERIKEFEFSVRQREKTNRIERKLINKYQAELDRRTLDIYFAEHPNLTPFAIGDFITVTENARKGAKGTRAILGGMFTIRGLKKSSVLFGDFLFRTTFELASEMRDTYLETIEQERLTNANHNGNS